jgi:hypothetical protein
MKLIEWLRVPVASTATLVLGLRIGSTVRVGTAAFNVQLHMSSQVHSIIPKYRSKVPKFNEQKSVSELSIVTDHS